LLGDFRLLIFSSKSEVMLRDKIYRTPKITCGLHLWCFRLPTLGIKLSRSCLSSCSDHVHSRLLIGVWFVSQLLHAGAVAHTQTGGVAYLAHVGGFIFGAVTVRFFEDPRRLALQPPGD